MKNNSKEQQNRKLVLQVFSIFVLMGLFFAISRADFTSTSFEMENPVNSIIEGGEASSTSFRYISSSGQLDNGQSSSTSFAQNAGFLYFPTATTPVLITTAGNTTVALSWTASVGVLANVTSYSVGVSTSPSGPFTYSVVGNVLGNTVTGLTNGTTYYFKVRAYASGLLLSESAAVSSTPAGAGGGPGGGGGGGGGGGTTTTGGTGVVNFSGRAFPLSKVYILKDGVIVASTIADPQANFSVSLSGLSSSTYTFSVYGTDSQNKKSASFSFPVYITEGATINIGSIFLSPTIDTDKKQVKQGENVVIFGQSVPNAQVTISVHSEQEYFRNVPSDNNGVYLLNFDTAPLELGGHLTKSKAAKSGEVSNYGTAVAFNVGNESIKKDPLDCSTLRGDLNCDGHVNLIDFSIMAYWYNKPNPPAKVDLNNDRKITLIDFSILAYNWTG